MGGIGDSNCNGVDAAFLRAASVSPVGAGNSFSMNPVGGSESAGPHLVPCPDSSRNHPGPQLSMAWFSADSPISPPTAAAGRSSQGDDPGADSVGNLQQVGLSSSILLSTSADVLRRGGSTSCTLLPSSPSPRPSLAPLPQHLASIFADLTNASPASSQPSASAESLLDLPSVSESADDCDRTAVVRVELTNITNGPGADGLDLMILGLPQSNSASKSVLSITDPSAAVATSSGDQDAVITVDHEKLEKSASELDQELLEEGELEDGELSGGWESGEDDVDDDTDDADNADPMNFRDDKHEEGEAEEEYEEEEAILDYRTEGLAPVGMRFGVDGRINQAAVGGFGNLLAKDHRKNSKRRKGKGALSRQRKRSRLEKAQKGSNEPIIDVSVDGRQQGGHGTSARRVESSGAARNAGGKQQLGRNTVEADTGPEEGEVVEEDNRGLLSQLVEEEVGLWTTDVGDEQITSSKVDSDDEGKKKVRAPISAERKLKKKVAFRRKRAEKEKELGLRRPRLPVNTFKPKVPLCKFYIKGRCTLGAKCTFSHDVVPITKSDPCKFFMVNRCLKGDDCPFSHSLDTFPCKFWHTRGHCLDGNNCRFSHGPLTDDQRQNLAKRIEHDSKEQQNVPDVSTDFNNAAEDSESSEYTPTVNNGQNEALGWDVNLPQALNQDTTCHSSTSMASHSTLNNRQAPSAALRTSFGGNQASVVLGEVNREEIQLTDTHKEDTPAENAVLLAARKAASAAAVQAAGTTDRLLLSRSGSFTSISLPKSRSFGRSLPGRGSEASAMDLLRASIGNDGGRDLSGNANSSQAGSSTGTLSALVACSANAAGEMLFSSSSPQSRAATSSLARGSSLGHTRQAVVPGSKGSAMELLQASLDNEGTPDDNPREVDFPGLST